MGENEVCRLQGWMERLLDTYFYFIVQKRSQSRRQYSTLGREENNFFWGGEAFVDIKVSVVHLSERRHWFRLTSPAG